MCFVWRGLRKKDIAIDPIPFKTLASRNSRNFYRRNEPAATIPSRVTVRRNRNKGQDATIFGVMQISTRHLSTCVMDDAKQFPIFQKSKKLSPSRKVQSGGWKAQRVERVCVFVRRRSAKHELREKDVGRIRCICNSPAPPSGRGTKKRGTRDRRGRG